MAKIIISGGGTGGHVFPAIAIANAIMAMNREDDILFIGAKGKLEMEKVPAAGYRIEGLAIAGFQRRFTLKNLSFPFKLIGSMIRARRIVSDFGPDVVIGVGGYASGPVLRTATTMRIPALIQEQNSYPGVTNRMLAAKVQKICVAFSGMEKYFPKEKLVLTGNPIRQDLSGLELKRNEALDYFGLDGSKITVLVIGGSLGAGTINKSVFNCLKSGKPGENIQWLWQCGKYYFENLSSELRAAGLVPGEKGLYLHSFINRMDLAYSAADVVISRAGAIAISELCAIGRPVILIPSPNVAEDHQMKNAMALADRKAAILIRDNEAEVKLGPVLEGLIADKSLQEELKLKILGMAVPDAADRIAKEALGLITTGKV
ncbi:MAG: undecaprenyldiphospho-muramoylpentapeptide beta-N-acetylglucosaminyltransferase [Bacteroidota bacterium]|jgi:UDP-N-acetylglucosamine--N-acetylmuramyl-(pentapeptide) pyrophosphoryl-undecaprenol N-acetylglucosamine transferase